MIPNSDLQRWQQAINGIATVQSELSPDELSAFQALAEFINNSNFEASESNGYIQVMKNALPQHAKNRLLKAHLTNFVTLCEKYFKAQVAVVAPAPIVLNLQPTTQPAVEAIPAPQPQAETLVAPPNVASADLPQWQKAIQGITAAQNDLSPDKQSTFQALVELYRNGNFEASESGGYIQALKISTTKNRLLKAHLTNFVTLCEKYFKVKAAVVVPPAPVVNVPQITPPAFEPPTFEPPVEVAVALKPQLAMPISMGEIKNDKSQSNNFHSGNGLMSAIIVISIVLAVSYFIIKDSEWFNNFLHGGTSIKIENHDEQTKQKIIINESQSIDNQMTITSIDVVEILKSLSNHNPDSDFNKALLNAKNHHLTDTMDFVSIFSEEYRKFPGASLAAIFSTYELKDKITPQSTDAQVEDFLRIEIKNAQSGIRPAITTYEYSTSRTIPGRFPQASERLLTASDLKNLSKNDLKIMRNEIFARHGYIFQTEAMKTYFQNQSWYMPKDSNVNSQLTNIEQKNIVLIQRYE